ncbi:IclR family transcriptional regulator [Variovorax terrae]|uniref:IclR family transcriptional regulator n=1 Tax=Variovorax terrae TaxID=2923278 RepID=A0A9X1VRI4_9BURK|nr:IclR family transcriptional regulator [Variovorax terrae]MCJ0762496.1 IclR family transcriptional regulator [Variovorax terrae]
MSMNEVKSAKRVLEILQFFAASQAPASLSQISAALGFPKSSCLALLDTLEAEGYAYQASGRYYLTRRWLNEAELVAAHDQVAARIRPVLEQLRAQLQETLILAQRSGDRVMYLDVAEADRTVRFAAHVGQTKPLHASASGRALLGLMPLPERTRLVDRLRLEAYTGTTVIDRASLLEVIEQGNRRGWHANLAEHQADTLSVAAPLVLHGMAFSLVVGAPMGRSGERVDEIGQALAAASRSLAQSIEPPRTTPSTKE